MDQTIGARFWAKVNCAGTHQSHMKTCCWEWEGAKDESGYGMVRYNGRVVRAHRFVLELAMQRPLQQKALHYCDNPCCVRPSHLHEGSSLLNAHERETRGRSNRRMGENHGMAKLTEATVTEIRNRYAAGESVTRLAEDYPVRLCTVAQIVRRESWKHVQ